jgi:predicted signal transduction protein with EAL and GGDEF domain
MSLRLPSLGLVSSVVGLANVDALLRRLASRLQHAMGDENVYSHRDWQFVVCVSTPAALAQPAVLAAELAELVQTLPSGTGVPLAVAVGWALYPEHGQQSDELLQRAELAATGPLHSGERRLRAYTPAMLEEALSRTRLESELRLAIARHELVPYLQPQVDLATGQLHGVEGLVR